MLKTAEGKWILFAVEGGEQGQFWPIDGKALIAAGTHTVEPPAGVAPVIPPPPPRIAQPPQPAVVRTFVGEDGAPPPDDRGRTGRRRASEAPPEAPSGGA